MLKKEEIKLETKKIGTRIKYFTTFSGQTESGGELAYLLVGHNGSKKIIENYLDIITKRNEKNFFEYTSGNTFYQGSIISEEKNLINQNTKDKIQKRYINTIERQYLNSLGLISGNTSGIITHVEFEDVEINDMFIDLSINRTIDTLDTLNIYNKPINEYPDQNSNTGVLFGRLTAIQNISDENGEKIIIPLKNTIVAIFNPSEQYPQITSVDENGNRISLHIKENIALNLNNNYSPYFDKDSFLFDYNYLKDTSTISNMPDMYKYTAITNENGEFILHNIPIGEQTFMYEVNMLKQGLTSDEVALNFFSYPTEDSPNIDKIPHYFFRQIPVNIVPSWGSNQTGYTEINLKVNLDLRKWATYTISPVAHKNKTIEEMFADGITNPITVEIRDMTKPFDFNIRPKVEVVEIADVYDRNLDQAHEWTGEFKQKKNKAEFTSTNFNYFKLPANLYDPNGINSNGEKGVWLAAYQFKMYYGNKDYAYKSTGFEREWFSTGPIGRNHFDLNKNANYGNQNVTHPVGKLGVWPYEKSWSINYPEPYKIPKPPSNFNTLKEYVEVGGEKGWAKTPEDPMFLDGDYPGHFVAEEIKSSGYGCQNIGGTGTFNMFAREVTTHGIYLYEKDTFWGTQWSNGFTPGIDNPKRTLNNLPTCNVLNGEKWQRLECGYVYWLKPEGWPRINTYGGWVDILSDGDQNKNTPPTSSNWGPPSYADGIYKSRENILIRMDSAAPWYRIGSLDIYRVVEPKRVAPKLPPPIEKFIRINVQKLIAENRRTRHTDVPTWLTIGAPVSGRHQFYRVSKAPIEIKNLGTTKVTIAFGLDVAEIEPGSKHYFEDAIGYESHFDLPSNSSYNSETNSYDSASYEINFRAIQTDDTSGGGYETNTGDIAYGGVIQFDKRADIESNIPNYYLIQVIPTIINLNGEDTYGSGSLNIYLPNPRIAINGFAYCLWSNWEGYGWGFPVATNNWVNTYWDNGWKPTQNPYMYLEDTPLITPFMTPYGGNFLYGYR